MKPNDLHYATMIKEQFPDLSIESIDSLGEGFRNYAVLVNGEWVFRFPKSQQGARELNKEIQLLPKLAGCLEVSIPEFVYIGRQSNGSSFVGYRKVQGEILGEDGMACIPDESTGRIARQLADFMYALNAFPVETAIQAGVQVRNLKNEFHLLKEAAEKQAFPLLEESLRTYLTLRFQSYLDHPAYTRYMPTLIHGDLSPDHYLTDSNQTELTGIIDFGDAAISDPDYDYVYLLEDCGEPFTRQVMTYRGVDDVKARIKKVSFFVTFDQVRYLLEGLESGDQDLISEGLEILEEDMTMNITS
ncbi:aminoglycoside phosphotransferase family protein [Cohnella pontilimi]|uniref:Aminoglycoside phosphotransferase family protein n=1 Tax=Cohnella pontilimi TaxID=2564100 RepID=A0A4U0FBJ1_9BACL|nr:aminoglycoside phosphotransferase family protein [Cohnella pontilimi]TJY41544.1 aminoglycoside phosphotransferase family protein [Cohnella pontilimi]